MYPNQNAKAVTKVVGGIITATQSRTAVNVRWPCSESLGIVLRRWSAAALSYGLDRFGFLRIELRFWLTISHDLSIAGDC